MRQHTPGPWIVCPANPLPRGVKWKAITAKGAVTFAYMPITGINNMEANTLLIAAAPELLEALKDIVCCARAEGPARTTCYFISAERMANANAAIAAAEGRQ